MVKYISFSLAFSLLTSAALAEDPRGWHLKAPNPSVELHMEVLSALEGRAHADGSFEVASAVPPSSPIVSSPVMEIRSTAVAASETSLVSQKTKPLALGKKAFESDNKAGKAPLPTMQYAQVSPMQESVSQGIARSAAPVMRDSAAIAAPAPAVPAAPPAQNPSLLSAILPGSGSQSTAASSPSVPAVATPSGNKGYIEGGLNYHDVDKNLGDWFGQYVKGEYQLNSRNRLSGELLHQREFRDDGIYAAIGDTYIFNDDWFGSLAVGGSTDGFFLPRYRVDGFLYKKWLPDRNLVTSVGLGHYKARDTYTDRSVSLGAIYYFDAPWILEGGWRYNVSRPGSVDSTSQFIALTQGRDNDHFITVRYGFGHESYQVIAPNSPISDFISRDLSVTWRQWLDDDWGFNLRGERYSNPTYHRYGLNAGIFKEF